MQITMRHGHSTIFSIAVLTVSLMCQSGWGQSRVRIRLETTNAANERVSKVVVGDTFSVRGFAEDLRPNSPGVFAAYVDISYDPSLVELSGSPIYGELFPNGQEGEYNVLGKIDNLGGFGKFEVPNQREMLLFELPIRAIGSGDHLFFPQDGGDAPMTDVLVYGENLPVPLEEIDYVGSSIKIVPEARGGVLMLAGLIIVCTCFSPQRPPVA